MNRRPIFATLVALLVLLMGVSGTGAQLPLSQDNFTTDAFASQDTINVQNKIPAPFTMDLPTPAWVAIHGHVMDKQGATRDGLRVQLLVGGVTVLAQTLTQADGGYRFKPLPSEAYLLRVLNEHGQPVQVEGAVMVAPGEAGGSAQHDLILIPEANSAHLVSADILATGQITGIVTASDTGWGISSVYVDAYDSAGNVVDSGYTDSNGRYTIDSLPTGNYKVMFGTYSGNYITPQWYDNQPDYLSATPVLVTDGTVTPNINAVLQLGGQVTGRVTAADTGTPLQGADVSIDGCDASYYASTDATGVYTVTGLPTGGYTVHFFPPYSGLSSQYLDQWYNNQGSSTATIIHVTAPNIATDINAALAKGGQIAGRVTGEGGAGIASVYVSAYDLNTYDGGGATTDASGYYTTTGLRTGNYVVSFSPSSSGTGQSYIRLYYNTQPTEAAANLVAVTAPNVTPNINQALTRGSQITGRVTKSDTMATFQGIWITVYDGSGNSVASGTTNSSGVYTTTPGLPSGNYRVKFAPPPSLSERRYAWEYHSNKSTLAGADVVSITAPNVVSNMDAALDQGGYISGIVTAADTGLPLQGVSVSIYDSTGEYQISGSASSNPAGMYIVRKLPTGNYRLRFSKSYHSSIISCTKYNYRYYHDKTSLSSANPVPVTAPLTTTNINQSLPLSAPPVPSPVTGVTISGPMTGFEQTTYIFDAAVSPFTATKPITYVWQATGQSPVTHTGGGASDSVNYSWSTSGSKAITITASNGLGTASNTHVIDLSPPPVPQAPTAVTISGPAVGFTQTNLAFNATVSPITATTPITYVWQATEQSVVTHTGGGTSDSVSFTWATTGTKAITVTAANALGAVTSGHTVDISSARYQVYLPVVIRQ